jgi:hypothetical protein
MTWLLLRAAQQRTIRLKLCETYYHVVNSVYVDELLL